MSETRNIYLSENSTGQVVVIKDQTEVHNNDFVLFYTDTDSVFELVIKNDDHFFTDSRRVIITLVTKTEPALFQIGDKVDTKEKSFDVIPLERKGKKGAPKIILKPSNY